MATKEGWEKADFPIVCETCLGDNPFVRMMKAEFDKECKICVRPFTVFRWKPGNNARFKKTEICQTCAKLKNVCQTCLLDLEFGLPVQVRDAALANNSSTALVTQAVSDTNRTWHLQQAEKEMENGTFRYDRADLRNQLAKVARTEPYYKRNAPHICTFFLKGQCNRGATCPYRHEMPDKKPGEEGEDGNTNNNAPAPAHTGSLQSIKDRYYGKNDPVAKKLLSKLNAHEIHPPADKTIKTVYVGGLTDQIVESDLKDQFYAFGEITEIRIVRNDHTDPNHHYGHAFVTFSTRQAAEAAVSQLHNNLIVKFKSLKVGWAKSQARDISNHQQQQSAANTSSAPVEDFFGLGGGVAASTPFVNAYVPPNPAIHKPMYPSMGTQKFGSKRDR